ncbi:MAG: hypothetical protein DRQ44_04245 [Gammaproteobacteria bacterium]|nr:MAG: hypothetical protein DRQ44_04245 [Gammaproteobacteria bacterium]
MASPCPDIETYPENNVQGGAFDDALFDGALVVTDTDFTSVEDCRVFASYFYETSDVSATIPEFSLLSSDLDVIVDKIWQPEEEQGFTLMFQAVFDWLKSFGLNVDTSALQEYLPSSESVRLFTEISAGLILLLALIFSIRGLYRAGVFKFSRKVRTEQDGLQPESEGVPSVVSVDGLPLRDQLAVLLKRSISLLRKYRVIPVSSSYTNHELIDYLDVSKSPLAKLLVRQVGIAEPVIYGAKSVTQEALVESLKICEDIDENIGSRRHE